MSSLPYHLRDAFAAWVEAGMPNSIAVEAEGGSRKVPAPDFLKDLAGSREPVPPALRAKAVECLRAELGNHPGALELDEADFETYAGAAHELLEILPELRLTRARPPMERLREVELREQLKVEPIQGARLVLLRDRLVGTIRWNGAGWTASLVSEDHLGTVASEHDDTDAADDFGVTEIAYELAKRNHCERP